MTKMEFIYRQFNVEYSDKFIQTNEEKIKEKKEGKWM